MGENEKKKVLAADMYSEESGETLFSLQMPELWGYLTKEEKNYFKNRITEYILERNHAINCTFERDKIDKKFGQSSFEYDNGKKLGRVLKKMRLEREDTLVNVAREIGISAASLSKYERGMQLPREHVQAQLASYYGITLEELRSSRANCRKKQSHS